MIVVTGATGNVGRALVELLTAAGEQVVASSRSVAAGAGVPPGVQVRPADLTEAAGLAPVFDGARALFLQSGGAAAHRLNPPQVLKTATAAGIEHVVLLSSQAVTTRPGSASHGAVLRSIEDAVRDSGLSWTILRPGGFASNTLAWAASVRAGSTVAAPFGDVGLPVVDPADIAAVAAAALRGHAHTGQTYELTGPALITPRAQAAAIGEATGRAIRFVELTRAQARAAMLHVMPEPVVDTTLAILGEPTTGERRVSPDVERVLGRAPGTYAAWARRNAAAFR